MKRKRNISDKRNSTILKINIFQNAMNRNTFTGPQLLANKRVENCKQNMLFKSLEHRFCCIIDVTITTDITRAKVSQKKESYKTFKDT